MFWSRGNLLYHRHLNLHLCKRKMNQHERLEMPRAPAMLPSLILPSILQPFTPPCFLFPLPSLPLLSFSPPSRLRRQPQVVINRRTKRREPRAPHPHPHGTRIVRQHRARDAPRCDAVLEIVLGPILFSQKKNISLFRPPADRLRERKGGNSSGGSSDDRDIHLRCSTPSPRTRRPRARSSWPTRSSGCPCL